MDYKMSLTGLLYSTLAILCLTIGQTSGTVVEYLLNKNIRIELTDTNQIIISLNRSNGNHHVTRIGQYIPLKGDPNWNSTITEFNAIWNNGIHLTLSASHDVIKNIYRLRTTWQAPETVSSMQTCINVTGENWYGGSEYAYQPWPIQNYTFPKIPYVTGGGGVGTVLAPYFISTASISFFASATNPLFVSLGTEEEDSLCLTSEFSDPYRNTDGRPLVLDVHTTWNDPPNMTALWIADSLTHFGHPSKLPSFKVIQDPIWSTWAVYKRLINQSKVLEFTDEINQRGFPASQIEVDDNWETCYGDEKFDSEKFPDPSAMVTQIKNYGYDVTLWVHPFVNVDCESFNDGNDNGYLVTVNGSSETGITSWWRGRRAGAIDVTNPSALDWWRARLSSLQTEIGITAFKFDAGETTWLPTGAYLASTDESLQPGSYSPHYTAFAKSFGDQVEARVGYFSQDQGGIFIRLLDRDSVWGLDNGLHSVITSTLHFGIVGYPYVLPDYIGGNAYGIHPDRELFIRWVELNAFLPVMQFSIRPWDYDDEVSNISLKMVKLHQSISDVIQNAANQAMQDGSPIIRPLWWLDWTDTTAQEINDEFLVGSEYLVAPIITQGATSRDIYVPVGSWKDMLRGGYIDGPKWLYNYSVSLEEIAYFRNNN